MYVLPPAPNISSTDISQPRDDVYGAYDPSHFSASGPNQHTQSPIVTGTSVLAAKFKDGVVIAADNLGMAVPSPEMIRSLRLMHSDSVIWLSRALHRCQAPTEVQR